MVEPIALTSRYKIGEEVKLNFGLAGELSKCKVAGVTFTDSKVYYHIDVIIHDDFIYRILNVDSLYLISV